MKTLMGWPNRLTWLRIGLIPVFIIVFYLPLTYAHESAAIIFTLASITDALDGYLARRLKQTSSFGAFLDPVADKLLVVLSLLILVGSPQLSYITLPAMVIVGREIIISALREWMAQMGLHASVAVGYIGKIKTSVQMLAIIFLIASPSYFTTAGVVGFILLYVSAILTIWSMIIYLMLARKTIGVNA